MDSRLRFSVFITFAVLAFAPQARAASCANMQIQLAQSNLDLTPNPVMNGSVTVKANTQSGGCSFFITFDYGTSFSSSTRVLRMGLLSWPVQLAKDVAGLQVLKRFPDVASNNDVLNGTLPNNQGNDTQVTLNFWALLETSNPWRRFGNYSDTLTLRLYKGTLSSYSYEGAINLSMNYNAPKRADLSLVSTGGQFNLSDTNEILDFGAMSTGAVRSCDLVMKTNAGYMLFASSENNGRLKHLTMSKYISYTARFSNSTVNLSNSAANPVQIERILGTSPSSGFVKPISVTIGSVAGAQSGPYSDVITLTVQTAE